LQGGLFYGFVLKLANDLMDIKAYHFDKPGKKESYGKNFN